MSNLFQGWDKEKLAVAATGHIMSGVTTDVCDTYYQLGSEEYKWHFPFNLIQKKFQSGLLVLAGGTGNSRMVNKTSLRYILVNRLFYPLMEWIGLFHSTVRLKLSDKFISWLHAYNPELLYLQVSSYDTILFAINLKNYLGIPSVIHIMDDWPSTISRKGPFKRYWQKRIDIAFRRLLNSTDLFLGISDAMADEYKKRYGKEFHPFHNPIDIDHWSQSSTKDYFINKDNIKILYSGRIGIGIAESLIEIAQAIEELNKSGYAIRFYIQSPAKEPDIIQQLLDFKCIVINPIADYSDLPQIFSSADILVIANDFDDKGISYLRYSMPTKASEYMISGTPILIYSHEDTAVTKFFQENQCGYCITKHSIIELIHGVRDLIEDEEYRITIATKAVALAKNLFDGNKRREEFRHLLSQTAKIELRSDSFIETPKQVIQ